MAIHKIEHVGVMVRDIAASAAFYEKVLGMKMLGTLNHPDPKIKLAFMGFEGAPETQLELIQGYNDQLPQEGKVHHIAFAVDQIEKEVERLRELKIDFIDQEITTLPNGARYILFHGPDGEWIELFESIR